MSKKIIHILANEPSGGVGNYLLGTLMNQYSYEIVENIQNPNSKFNCEMRKRDIIIHDFPSHKNLIAYNIATKKFYKRYAKDIDAIHIHSTAVALPHLFWSKIYHINNRIIHIHSNYLRGVHKFKKIRNKFILSMIFYLSNRIAVCGPDVGELVPKKYFFRILPNTIIVSNFIFQKKQRNKIRRELNLANKKVFGIIGRVSAEKNHIFLIDIFKELPLDYVLLIIGEGPKEMELKAYCIDQKISNVIFLGKKDQVVDYMHALDGLLMPSIVEGFPMVPIEAQANGLPCIVSESIDKTIQVIKQVEFFSLYDQTKWKKLIFDLSPLSESDRIAANAKVYSHFDIHIGQQSLIDFYDMFLQKGPHK